MNRDRLSWEWVVLAVCCVFALGVQVIAPGNIGATGQGEAAFVPIVMYHSLLKDPARANSYTVSPQTFENDLRYLIDAGYETVVIQDLIDYVRHGTPLPDKPVVITFDDGHLNTLTYGLPILQKYNAKAVVSVVGAYVERAVAEADPNPLYAYVTWDDLRQMAASGCFEIQNHSYDLHKHKGSHGAVRKEGEVLNTYQQRLTSDVLKMQQALFDMANITATAFTYPYGLIDKEGELVLRELGFAATLTCVERPNYITRSPDSLYLLGRYNRPAGMTTYQFMKKALER